MIPNHSPWIQQLNRTRPVVPLASDAQADVAIVGGGIAGVCTAFFTLRDTKQSVILLEAEKIAHGATGHNAGQIASYFERPLHTIAEEYGLALAAHGQQAVESGWTLLDRIMTEAGLRTQVYRFTGFAGLSSLEHVLAHLKNNRCRLDGGLQTETIVVAEDWEGLKEIPSVYNDLYETTARENVLALLETKNGDYVAALSYQKGCMNSALFSEELIGYLIATYRDRFSFYEGTPVKTVRLTGGAAILETPTHRVEVKKVVLCTNGFEHFTIVNEDGPEIDTAFHHAVAGRIGYMSGYVEPLNHPPTAISYFLKANAESNDPTGESYFYLTRRPLEHEGRTSYNLVCTGGPDKVLPNGASYSREESCSEEVRESVHDFLEANYEKYPNAEMTSSFCWHGLMGYTPNGIRRIGPEPRNGALLYNLGCNGVGILPSIYGGARIARHLNGERLEPSIFDPGERSA